MSNCVSFRAGGTARIPVAMIDAAGLLALCDAVRGLPEAPENLEGQPSDLHGYCAWWYLTNAGTDRIVRVQDGHVVIEFEAGRSGHTWRDLRQTVYVIGTFMKPGCEQIHECRLEDEGQSGAFRERLIFVAGDIQTVPRFGYERDKAEAERRQKVIAEVRRAEEEQGAAHRRKRAGANWERDDIQFPRLIAELQMAGAFTPGVMESLCSSMDLSQQDLAALIERATAAWDQIVAKT